MEYIPYDVAYYTTLLLLFVCAYYAGKKAQRKEILKDFVSFRKALGGLEQALTGIGKEASEEEQEYEVFGKEYLISLLKDFEKRGYTWRTGHKPTDLSWAVPKVVRIKGKDVSVCGESFLALPKMIIVVTGKTIHYRDRYAIDGIVSFGRREIDSSIEIPVKRKRGRPRKNG